MSSTLTDKEFIEKYNETHTIPGIEPEKDPAIDWRSLYEDSKTRLEQLENELSAVRTAQAAQHATDTFRQNDRRPAVDAEQVKARAGASWHQMSRDGKLSALGIDPTSITDERLRQLFGRGNDGKLSSDLHKSNPFQYRRLKQAALALDIYCA